MRIVKESKITYAEVLYLFYFGVMFGAKAVGLYEGMLLYNLSLVLGMVLFSVKILFTKHTIFEYVLMVLLGGLSGIVYYNTGEKGLLLYITMMLGMKGVSIERVFRWATFILATCFSSLIFLTSFGIIQDIYYIKDRAFFGMVMRRSLGYPYPNTLFTTYIVLMVLVMYVLGEMNRKQLLIISLLEFIGAVYMFLYSCSNTGIIVSMVFLILNYYFQTRKSFTKLEKILVQLVYPGCVLFSVVGPMISKGKLFEFLDKVLHNRWNYSRYYLTNEPITLLGQRFKPAPNTNYLIDSSFLYSFLQIGVVAFIVITVLNMAMIHDYTKQEKRVELAIIVSFCILGLSDPFLYNLSYKNLLFLFIGEFFYRKISLITQRSSVFLQKEIQWLKIGNKEIAIEKLYPRGIREKIEMIESYLKQNYFYVTVLFLLSTAFVAGMYFLITYLCFPISIADNVEKWEYIRMGINSGVWGGILSMLWLTLRKSQILDRVNSNNKDQEL